MIWNNKCRYKGSFFIYMLRRLLQEPCIDMIYTCQNEQLPLEIRHVLKGQLSFYCFKQTWPFTETALGRGRTIDMFWVIVFSEKVTRSYVLVLQTTQSLLPCFLNPSQKGDKQETTNKDKALFFLHGSASNAYTVFR